jgi:hypothetical protein
MIAGQERLASHSKLILDKISTNLWYIASAFLMLKFIAVIL